jgi:hypothetical protein
MGVSVVGICNLALSHLSADLINSLSDATKEARQCNLLYESARDFVLQDHPWGFSERRVELSLLSEQPIGYSYAYQYPTECLLARKIYQEIKTAKPINFEEQIQENLTSRMIVTDQADAVLVYTAKITDTNVFSPVFTTTLSWKLASDLAKPITGKASVSLAMLQIYNAYRNRAVIADATESRSSVETENDFIKARS